MFVVICRAQVKPEKAALYEDTFRALRATVLANEPGIRFYELCRMPDQPNTYRLVEAYDDQAAQDLHLAAPYYQQAAGVIMDCLVDNSFEMEVVEAI